MRVLSCIGAMAIVAGAAGCSAATTNVRPPGPVRTIVLVQNKSMFDVNVYVWDSGERATHLGIVTAGSTLDLDVPEAVLAATGPFSLEARPTVGAEYPTNSERFALRPGYRITWAIPPTDQLGAARDDSTSSSDTAARLPGQ